MKREGCRNGLVFRFGGCGVRAGSEDGKEKNFPQEFGISKKRVTFAVPNPYEGSLAQLVQSVCLTSRGSGVRIPQLPRNETRRLPQPSRFFVLSAHGPEAPYGDSRRKRYAPAETHPPSFFPTSRPAEAVSHRPVSAQGSVCAPARERGAQGPAPRKCRARQVNDA